MVLGLSSEGEPVRFKVKANGAAPGDDHGADSASDGTGEVREPRMYQLIRQKGPIKDATFEIEFLDPSVEAFVYLWLRHKLYDVEIDKEQVEMDICYAKGSCVVFSLPEGEVLQALKLKLIG